MGAAYRKECFYVCKYSKWYRYENEVYQLSLRQFYFRPLLSQYIDEKVNFRQWVDKIFQKQQLWYLWSNNSL